MNSNKKGKRGELEFANKMNAYGWSCRRSQQFCGAAGDADLHCELPLHIEAAIAANTLPAARPGESWDQYRHRISQ